MKYIRTKDGIYLNGGKFGKPYSGIVGKKHEYDFGYCFNKRDIIKQADTIEELCDVFVMKTHLTYYTNSHLKDLLLEYDKFHIKDGIAIYGAIWTDKGLIYVAKMNDKGELELI